MLALSPLSEQVDVSTGGLVRQLGQLGVDVVGESAEVLDVHALALAQVVVQVGDERSPDDQHLGLGLERLLRWVRAAGRVVVLAGVASVVEDPERLLAILTSR